MPVVLNLGGEAEVEGAINVNSMLGLILTERPVQPPDPWIEANAHQLPFKDGSADRIIANRFPVQYGEILAAPGDGRADLIELTLEMSRVLRTNGTIHFSCSSCDRAQLLEEMRRAGLEVRLGTNGIIQGSKQ